MTLENNENKKEIEDRYYQVREDQGMGRAEVHDREAGRSGQCCAWEGTWEATHKTLKRKVKIPIVIMFELDPPTRIIREQHFYDEASLERALQLPRPR